MVPVDATAFLGEEIEEWLRAGLIAWRRLRDTLALF
jgi:hypothetical protein